MLPEETEKTFFVDDIELNKEGISIGEIGSAENSGDLSDKKVVIYPACFGAVFSGTGKLVVFSNRTQNVVQTEKRTYDDFKLNQYGVERQPSSFSISGFFHNTTVDYIQ